MSGLYLFSNRKEWRAIHTEESTMRTVKVKEEKSKYRLKADDGTYIGELLIQYDSRGQKCNIWIAKKGQSMTSLTIGRG